MQPSAFRETNASPLRGRLASGGIIKIHQKAQRKPQSVECSGILGICMHAFMQLCFCFDPTQHKFYPPNVWKETVGRVRSSGENAQRCSLPFSFVCEPRSAPMNQFNLLCMNIRLSSQCMQDDTNTEIGRGRCNI